MKYDAAMVKTPLIVTKNKVPTFIVSLAVFSEALGFLVNIKSGELLSKKRHLYCMDAKEIQPVPDKVFIDCSSYSVQVC